MTFRIRFESLDPSKLSLFASTSFEAVLEKAKIVEASMLVQQQYNQDKKDEKKRGKMKGDNNNSVQGGNPTVKVKLEEGVEPVLQGGFNKKRKRGNGQGGRNKKGQDRIAGAVCLSCGRNHGNTPCHFAKNECFSCHRVRHAANVCPSNQSGGGNFNKG